MREFLTILCMLESGRPPVGIYSFKELPKHQTKGESKKKETSRWYRK